VNVAVDADGPAVGPTRTLSRQRHRAQALDRLAAGEHEIGEQVERRRADALAAAESPERGQHHRQQDAETGQIDDCP
jgi:hypothetical protein